MAIKRMSAVNLCIFMCLESSDFKVKGLKYFAFYLYTPTEAVSKFFQPIRKFTWPPFFCLQIQANSKPASSSQGLQPAWLIGGVEVPTYLAIAAMWFCLLLFTGKPLILNPNFKDNL